MIEKTVLERRLTIEKIRKENLVPDAAYQKKFVQDAEQHINEKVKVEIDKLVKEKIEEYNTQKKENNKFNRAVEKQYNFIVEGGNVNFYVVEGDLIQEIERVENTKEEIEQIKSAHQNQQLINQKNNTNE